MKEPRLHSIEDLQACRERWIKLLGHAKVSELNVPELIDTMLYCFAAFPEGMAIDPQTFMMITRRAGED